MLSPGPPNRPDPPTQRWHETEAGGHLVAYRAWQHDPQHRDTTARRPAGPVVLVHGLVVSSSYHVPLAQHLARHHDVYAPDLPGFGRSSRPDTPLDTRELGFALAAWLDALDLGRVSIVANSYGCQIVSETLLGRPELADRLVLLGPTIDRYARRYDEQLRRWRLEQKTQSFALQRLLVGDYAKAGIPRAIATFRHAMEDAIEDRLPFLELPTMVVRGTRDPIVSSRWAAEVADLLPDATLLHLPGATHAVNHEMPLQTARVTEHFLQRSAA